MKNTIRSVKQITVYPRFKLFNYISFIVCYDIVYLSPEFNLTHFVLLSLKYPHKLYYRTLPAFGEMNTKLPR